MAINITWPDIGGTYVDDGVDLTFPGIGTFDGTPSSVEKSSSDTLLVSITDVLSNLRRPKYSTDTLLVTILDGVAAGADGAFKKVGFWIAMRLGL